MQVRSVKISRFTLVLELSCYTCKEVVDAYNRTVGDGDIGCFEGKDMDSYLQECPEDKNYCKTTIEADWYPKGDHQYRIIRECSSRSSAEYCFTGTGEGGLIQYKDCETLCNTTACNDGDEGLRRFAEDTPSNVLSCYACEMQHFSTEPILGDLNCANMTGMNKTYDCPSYAQNSCATSAMHLGSITENLSFDNTFYRTCSPFVHSGENFINATNGNGYGYFGYKDSCTSNNCNNKTSDIDDDLPDFYCRFGLFY